MLLEIIMKIIDLKLLKFLLVGVVNTIFGAGIMFLLYNLFHVNYWISSACNYIFGGILSYFLNKYFTFKNDNKNLRQILIFIVNLAICYAIAYIGAKRLMLIILSSQPVNIQENIAMLAGMCIYTGLNYLGQRFIVFKENNIEENIQAEGESK